MAISSVSNSRAYSMQMKASNPDRRFSTSACARLSKDFEKQRPSRIPNRRRWIPCFTGKTEILLHETLTTPMRRIAIRPKNFMVTAQSSLRSGILQGNIVKYSKRNVLDVACKALIPQPKGTLPTEDSSKTDIELNGDHRSPKISTQITVTVYFDQ